MISLSKVLNVREVAITPTSIDAITRPVMVQTTANNLAHTPTGTLSPYLINKHKHPMINLKNTIIYSHCLTNANHCYQVSNELVHR